MKSIYISIVLMIQCINLFGQTIENKNAYYVSFGIYFDQYPDSYYDMNFLLTDDFIYDFKNYKKDTGVETSLIYSLLMNNGYICRVDSALQLSICCEHNTTALVHYIDNDDDRLKKYHLDSLSLNLLDSLSSFSNSKMLFSMTNKTFHVFCKVQNVNISYCLCKGYYFQTLFNFAY